MIRFVIFLGVFIFASILMAQDQEPSYDEIGSYNKAKILLDRYGLRDQQDIFSKTLMVRETVNQSVVGQDDIAAALQIRLFQYINSVGSRKSEPIALHMIGLPGIGKTSILKVLEDLGFPVFKIDAEKFPKGEKSSVDYNLMEAFERAADLKRTPETPLILFIDELDKVPEKNKNLDEVTQPVISSLNEILSEGKLTDIRSSGKKLDFSNVFLLTAMNFAPGQIEKFSAEILAKEKSFWDFNEEDMIKFDQWIRSSSSAQGSIAKVLSLIFRSNTVGRLIPDALVAKALFGQDFDQIVKINAQSVVERLTNKKGLSLRVKYTDRFLDFLRKITVFVPSGARMSVKKVDLLMEQLISIASRIDLGNPNTLALPRDIEIDVDPDLQTTILKIKALSKKGTETKVIASEQVSVSYNQASGSFNFPIERLKLPPEKFLRKAIAYADQDANKKLSRGKIRKLRSALRSDRSLENYLNTVIFDQSEISELLDQNLHLYMNSKEEAIRYQTIPGFTGVGKTALILAAAEKLNLPVVKINMQEYSGDSQEAADKFGADLVGRIKMARAESRSGKFIILIEELDKAFEVDPTNGKLVRRPVMAYIKDLLTDGSRSVMINSSWGSYENIVDIKQAYTVLTMNFALDRFNLKADPRLTTIEDMEKLYDEISSSPEAIRGLFATMFLPETINRLISNNMKMARPLSRQGYQRILLQQVEESLRELSSNLKSKMNHGAIRLKLSDSYFEDYLFAESVIPSEGGRQAALTAKSILIRDTLEAIRNIPKSSSLFVSPIEIYLDFKPKITNEEEPLVMATAYLQDEHPENYKRKSETRKQLYSSKRELRFPALGEFGKSSPRRLLTAAHEFGHAYAATIFGYRFEFASAVSPTPGIGGYVKPRSLEISTGKALLADLMFSIGSRAMERIILSETPKDKDSVLALTSGPRSDIRQATTKLWEMIYQLGMDPGGGVLERMGLGGQNQNEYSTRDYFFSEVPDEKVTQLAFIIGDLENYLVDQMLLNHEPQWYLNHIKEFARRGGVNEQEFYDLIGYKFPGDNEFFLGEELRINQLFLNDVTSEPKSVTQARQFRQQNGRTASENMEHILSYFKTVIAQQLHGESPKTRHLNVCYDLFVGKNSMDWSLKYRIPQ